MVVGGGLLVNELQHCLCFIQQAMLRLPVYIWFHDNRDTFPGLANDNTDGLLEPSTWTDYPRSDEVFDSFQQSLLERSLSDSWWPIKQAFKGFVFDFLLTVILSKQSFQLKISFYIYANKTQWMEWVCYSLRHKNSLPAWSGSTSSISVLWLAGNCSKTDVVIIFEYIGTLLRQTPLGKRCVSVIQCLYFTEFLLHVYVYSSHWT